jgi:uncharacterized protein
MTATNQNVEQANIAVVQKMFAAVANRGDSEGFAEKWAAYLSLFDKDVVIHEAASLPYGGDYVGAAGVAAHAKGFSDTWSALQSSEHRGLQPSFLAKDDQVVVLWRQQGTNPQTGEQFDMPVTSVYRLKDERVAESRMLHFDAGAVRDFLARASTI